MSERLTPAGLEEIRERATSASNYDGTIGRCITLVRVSHLDVPALLAHVAALEADLRQAESQVAVIREALYRLRHPSLAIGLREADDADADEVLADTEAAVKAHDRWMRLEGARALYEQVSTRLWAPTEQPMVNTAADVLADMERESS